MDKLQKQIESIKKQQQELDVRLNQLLDQRNEILLGLIKSITTANFDIFTLIGGVLDIVEKMKQPSDQGEEWRLAGQKFCRKYGSRFQKTAEHAKKNESNA